MLSQLRRTYRLWWQKPQSISNVPEEREVTFLELFYDLAYVVIIIQLTHTLAGHLDLTTFFEYIGLYAMVWFAWINGTFYHELHGNNDIRSRVVTFAQMFALLWMAIFVSTAFSDDGYQGFAYAYAGFLAIIGLLWWRTGVHDPEHRPLSNPYALAFLGASGAFIASAFVDLADAQYIWLAAIAFMLTLPFISFSFRRNVSEEHLELSQRIRAPLVERFGLLTIIILGENLISIVGGAAYRGDFSAEFVLQISAAIGIVFLMWWTYFDVVSHRIPVQKTLNRMSWLYLHLPLTMSIGLTAVGLLNAIEYVKYPEEIDRWIIIGPLAVFLLVVNLIVPTLQVRYERFRPIFRAIKIVSLLSVLGLIGIGLAQLSMLNTILLSFVLMSLPMATGISFWIKRRERDGE